MMARRRAPARGAGPAHAALRRRDPPLQPRAAGRLPALRRARRHRAGRRHHREPVVRAQRGAALALPRGGARAARDRGSGERCSSARSPIASAASAAPSVERGAGGAGRRSRSSPPATRGARSTCSSWRSPTPPRGGALDAETVAPRRAAQGAALRQGRRGALQPDLGAPQVAARERPRRRALLARAHARGRRGSRLPGAPHGALRRRGRRPRRSAGAAVGARRLGGLRPPRLARRASSRWRRRRSTSRSRRRASPSTRAEGAARRAVAERPAEPVPLAIRNAPTPLMKELGYGRDYVYAPDTEEGMGGLECLPDALAGTRFYQPDRARVRGRAAPAQRAARRAAREAALSRARR